MIRVHGRLYASLPQTLKTCPCERGSLAWDGHFGWRCDARKQCPACGGTGKDGDGFTCPECHGHLIVSACHGGVTLDGVFQHPRLDRLFRSGRVDITQLAVTPLFRQWQQDGEVAVMALSGNRVQLIEDAEAEFSRSDWHVRARPKQPEKRSRWEGLEVEA